MALQDAEADGEAEAGAGADVLGGEKGIKDFFLVLFGDTDAVVCDDEFDRVSGLSGFNDDLTLRRFFTEGVILSGVPLLAGRSRRISLRRPFDSAYKARLHSG